MQADVAIPLMDKRAHGKNVEPRRAKTPWKPEQHGVSNRHYAVKGILPPGTRIVRGAHTRPWAIFRPNCSLNYVQLVRGKAIYERKHVPMLPRMPVNAYGGEVNVAIYLVRPRRQRR